MNDCESSLFNNEGIKAHCSNNEPNNEPPARFWEIISPWEIPNSECRSTVSGEFRVKPDPNRA